MAGSFEWTGNELSLGNFVANGLSAVDIAANLSFCVVGGKTGEAERRAGGWGPQGQLPAAEWRWLVAATQCCCASLAPRRLAGPKRAHLVLFLSLLYRSAQGDQYRLGRSPG